MLMERIGKESLEGGGPGDLSGLQERTLIQGLCDLLERTWGHGLQLKQVSSHFLLLLFLTHSFPLVQEVHYFIWAHLGSGGALLHLGLSISVY